jgi:hypothetical protein
MNFTKGWQVLFMDAGDLFLLIWLVDHLFVLMWLLFNFNDLLLLD